MKDDPLSILKYSYLSILDTYECLLIHKKCIISQKALNASLKTTHILAVESLDKDEKLKLIEFIKREIKKRSFNVSDLSKIKIELLGE